MMQFSRISSRSLRRTRAALLAVVASTLPLSPQIEAGPLRDASAAADVPPGITLASVRIGGSDDYFGGSGRDRGQAIKVLADSKGEPLYFNPADCVGTCLEKWRPALAPPEAKAQGDWTLIARGDHQKQWAFRGRPLFSFVEEPPFVLDITRTDNGSREFGFVPVRRVTGHGVQGWVAAQVDPNQWMKMPRDISATEYRMAPGQTLAIGVGGASLKGKALYVFHGSASQERSLPAVFRPRLAAALDLPVGDFTIVVRPDGSRQWAFRAAPLYTCDCDVDMGDVNGRDLDPGISPAVAFRYFTPAEVVLKTSALSGGRMVEARTGRILYYRDRDRWEAANLRYPEGADPRVGAALGLQHCDARCEKEWKPLLAPRNAKAQGHWSVYERPDGSRQWAYYNSALYTHPKDPPGSLFGDDTYTIRYNEGLGEEPVPDWFGIGIMWRAVVP